ncbi:MAG: NAD(P)H-binding protein [Bacteroidales bacterium]|nr:NAD(P)H-binding protein [Bacteroidales bacterium]
MKTAVLFGGTGMIGGHLFDLLLNDKRYDEVKVFTRNPIEVEKSRIKLHIIDFDKLDQYSSLIKGDELFCSIGTTLKKAGSKENFAWVDHDLPVKLAEIASKNKIKGFYIVSSIGANPNSSSFYLRTKGQMEEDVLKHSFKRIVIVRPSMLLGKREEQRFGEELGKAVLHVIDPLMIGRLKKYKGIQAKTVARAMIKVANLQQIRKNIYESNELKRLAGVKE